MTKRNGVGIAIGAFGADMTFQAAIKIMKPGGEGSRIERLLRALKSKCEVFDKKLDGITDAAYLILTPCDR